LRRCREVDPSIGVLVDVQNTLVINALLRWGSDDVKRRYLPKMAASTIGAYALSEAGSGSDAFAMTTRAVERGDEWTIAGRKAVDYQRQRGRLCSSCSRT
jgi:alkylation response protein AidB-like acyl-CoA dehydrogenase